MGQLTKINKNEKPLQPRSLPSGKGDSSRRMLTALVIDGDGFCQFFEKAILQSQGLKTQTVGSGAEALDIIASGTTFDLIIVAWVLPDINGAETARLIRELGYRGKMWSVTACPVEWKYKFMDAGVDEFIPKPLTLEKVAAFVNELLQHA